MEQGQVVVLSPLFSPPAWVGVGRWWRCLYSLFTLHFSLFLLFVGRGFPDAPPVSRRKGGVGADIIRPKAFPRGKVAFAKQMTDEGGL